MATEKKLDLAQVNQFDKDKLTHAETCEKKHMPDASEIARDRSLKGIQEFKKESSLKSVDTVEKVYKPTKEDIESEKKSAF